MPRAPGTSRRSHASAPLAARRRSRRPRGVPPSAGGPTLNDTKVDLNIFADELLEEDVQAAAPVRRLAWLALIPVAILLALAGLVFILGRPYAEVRGLSVGVIVLRGNVETAAPDGSGNAVTAGATVAPGASIRTARGAEAAVYFADGSAVRLRPDSELRIDRASEELRAPGLTTGLLKLVGFFGDVPTEPDLRLSLSAELVKGEALVLTPATSGERSTLVLRAGPALASGSDTSYQVELSNPATARVRALTGAPVVFGIGRSGAASAGLLASIAAHQSTTLTTDGSADDLAQWFALGQPLLREAVRRSQLHVITAQLEAVGRVSETGAIIYANSSGARPSAEDLRKIASALDIVDDNGIGIASGSGEFLAPPFVLKPIGREAFRDNLPPFLDVRPIGGNALWASTPFGSGPLWLDVQNGRLNVIGLPPGIHFPGLPGAFVQVAGVGDALNVVYAPLGEG